jgi:tetratricopeptide (TPR) repeat protein
MKLSNGHDILEAEHSEEIDDDMSFTDSVTAKPAKLQIETKKNAGNTRGATMFINGKPIMIDKKEQALNKREKSNWLVHILFIRQEYVQCMKFVDELLQESDKSEYALYLKALILRIKGNIHDSLDLFKKCHLLNPNNIEYLKQFGRSLYLLGRHK